MRVFLGVGVKRCQRVRLTTSPPSVCRLSGKCGILNIPEALGLHGQLQVYLYFSFLFLFVLSVTGYGFGWEDDELEGIWKEIVVAQIEILSWNLLGGTD
jgi:hypothetical protein